MVEPQNNMPAKENELSWQKLLDLFGLTNRISKVIVALALVLVLFVSIISFFLIPPTQFAPGSRVVIKQGVSLGEVSLLLQEQNFIRSRVLFEFCAITIGGDKRIMAGEYLFKEPVGACAIAARITGGVFGVPATRITIPEGLSNKEAAVIFAKSLPKFDSVAFATSSRAQEGFLFPDTYFFSPHATAADVIGLMRENFDRKIKPLSLDIEKSGHSLRDIVIMASILEKEVATDDDRAFVSGILWRRISQGMPLQVDAPFMYLLNKKSSELTYSDLQLNSPYNTYRNKGLPVGPINNPGISSIQAALSPKASSFLYYLSDANGITHYAKTFDEHKANKIKYLQ